MQQSTVMQESDTPSPGAPHNSLPFQTSVALSRLFIAYLLLSWLSSLLILHLFYPASTSYYLFTSQTHHNPISITPTHCTFTTTPTSQLLQTSYPIHPHLTPNFFSCGLLFLNYSENVGSKAPRNTGTYTPVYMSSIPHLHHCQNLESHNVFIIHFRS